MLIEALSKLAHKVGAEQMTLTISPSDGGEGTVLVVPCLGHSAKTSEDKDQGKLVAALSSPLVVKGNVGELDSRLVNLIDELEDDYQAASKELPETDAQKRRRELSEAATKKEGKDKKAAAKKPNEKAGKEEDESKDKSDDSHAEALATGEADSL
jgi:hypothetical protein